LKLALVALKSDSISVEKYEATITAVEQALALDKMAENARELGLDYEPVDGTQVSKVWWDGEKLMAKPIPLEDFYLPVQEPVAWVDLLKQAEEVVRSKSLWKKYIDGTPLANDIAVWMASFAQEHTTPPAAQPAPTVQEPSVWTATRLWNRRGLWTCPADIERDLLEGYATPPPAQPAPVQEPVAWMFEDDEDNGHKTFRQTPPSLEVVAYLAKWNRPAWVPLYTTPPAAPVPLTDEQIDVLRESKSKGRGAGWSFDFKGFARAIEAAHGITKG
jgi:hypothetical protein